MNLTKRLLILEKIRIKKAIDHSAWITNIEIETVGMNEEREIITIDRHWYFKSDLEVKL